MREPGPIIDVQVFQLRLPVQTPRAHGSGDVTGTIDVVLLRLECAAGDVGWGEAAPWAVFTGTAEAAFAALDVHLRPLLEGADPVRLPMLMAMAERRLVGHPEAKAALETALFDLLGRARGVPVWALLGGLAQPRIALSFSIAQPDFAADMAMVEELVAQGVRLFKLKTGVTDHRFDLHRLETLRQRFGDAIDLRVDYNQGLEPADAIRRLRDVEVFRPTFIEQPVPACQPEAMAAIAAALDTPIMADESVFGPEDALRAVNTRLADMISVKVMKTGGLRRAQHVAAIAAAAGWPAYGGDMFETGLAHLAGTHLIAATPAITLGCEFYQARWYLEDDVLAEPFPIEAGEVVVPTTAGLGVAVDEERVRRHAVAHGRSKR